MTMTTRVGGPSRLLGTALLGMIVPWIACASGSEDQSLNQAPTIAPRQHRPMIIRERHSFSTSSSNWSGYAVTGGNDSVSDVKGSWVVPALPLPGQLNACTSGTQYSSFWVGIDGYSSNTVEQIGTDSDCQNGSPVYYAWYEFYPKFPYNIPIAINKNDVISAEVSYSGGQFTVSITDCSPTLNTCTSWKHSEKMPNAKRSSAEWIIEDSGGLLPDFGTVYFGQDSTGVSNTCYATVLLANEKEPTTGSIGSFGASVFEITMVDGTTVMSQPSSLSDGTSFTDTWMNQGP
jgi:hypothetical protein